MSGRAEKAYRGEHGGHRGLVNLRAAPPKQCRIGFSPSKEPFAEAEAHFYGSLIGTTESCPDTVFGRG